MFKNNQPLSQQETEKRFKLIAAAIIGIFILIVIVGSIVVSSMFKSTSTPEAGTMGGLQNPENIFDPDPITSGDVQHEYDQREEYPEEERIRFRDMVSTYINVGQFELLQAYLLNLRTQYKNGNMEEDQGEENMEYVLDSMIGDLQTTINLADCASPNKLLACYANPDILAATIAYAPIMCKYQAFLDWNCYFMPAVQKGDAINLTDVTPDNAASILARINENKSENYWDIKIYEMSLYGYKFRLACVMANTGYYQPYTLRSADGYGRDVALTDDEITSMIGMIDYRNTIDDIVIMDQFSEEAKTAILVQYPERISHLDEYFLNESGGRDDDWEIGLGLDDWEQTLGSVENPEY